MPLGWWLGLVGDLVVSGIAIGMLVAAICSIRGQGAPSYRRHLLKLLVLLPLPAGILVLTSLPGSMPHLHLQTAISLIAFAALSVAFAIRATILGGSRKFRNMIVVLAYIAVGAAFLFSGVDAGIVGVSQFLLPANEVPENQIDIFFHDNPPATQP